jgi:hypothetical protein
MLNYGIGATRGKKATSTKKKATKSVKSAVAAPATAVKSMSKKVTAAKKKVVAAEKAVAALKPFQKRRLKAGRWASYGKSSQGTCSNAGRVLKKNRSSVAGSLLRRCKD